MITLHQYPAVWGLSSLSPFCIKVEVFLKLAKLSYQVKVELNPSRGPMGKMPFIRDESATIADSSFIIDHLIQKHKLSHLNHQSHEERTRFIMIKHLIEESLYFNLLHSRWIEGNNFESLKREFIPLFPKFLGGPALHLIRKNLIKQSRAQGIGRHSQNDINRISRDQIFSLNQALGEDDYFLGKRVSALDATAYSFLVTILKQPFESFLKTEVSKYPNLIRYTERMELLIR